MRDKNSGKGIAAISLFDRLLPMGAMNISPELPAVAYCGRGFAYRISISAYKTLVSCKKFLMGAGISKD